MVVEEPVVEELVVVEEPVVVEPVVEEPVSPVAAARARAARLRNRTAAEPLPATESAEPVVVEADAPAVRAVVPSRPAPRPVRAVRPATRSASRAVARERFALERRLASLEGRTDAASLSWAQSIRAKLDALDA